MLQTSRELEDRAEKRRAFRTNNEDRFKVLLTALETQLTATAETNGHVERGLEILEEIQGFPSIIVRPSRRT